MNGFDKASAELQGGRTVRAYVHMQSREIPYLRSGRGAAVLLIVADAGWREELRIELSRHFTVIAPEPDARWHGMRSEIWLRDLGESLGLERPHLVAAEPYGLAVLHFSLAQPELSDRVVALWHDAATAGEVHDDAAHALEGEFGRTRRRFLLLRIPVAPATAVTDPARPTAGPEPAAVVRLPRHGLACLARFLGAG